MMELFTFCARFSSALVAHPIFYRQVSSRKENLQITQTNKHTHTHTHNSMFDVAVANFFDELDRVVIGFVDE